MAKIVEIKKKYGYNITKSYQVFGRVEIKNNKCTVFYNSGFNRVWINDMKESLNEILSKYGIKDTNDITIIKPSFGCYFNPKNSK